MSSILTLARALMAVMGPQTGTRATGTCTVKSVSGSVDVPRNSYAVPIVDGDYRPDLVMKVAEGPNDDGSWTVTTGGTQVDFLSNIGGARHNIDSATKLVFDPALTTIASVEVDSDFAGGLDPTMFGGLRDVVFSEHLEGPSRQLDVARSMLKGFPGAIIAWEDSEAADGSTTSMTARETRAGTRRALYRESFVIGIYSSRDESDHMRRTEGLAALDAVSQLIADRQSVDGQPFSNPSGVQIRRRWRERGPQAVYQRFYVYGLLAAVENTLQAVDSRTYSDWETAVIDVLKPQDPALPNQGDYTVVDDMTVDMTP